MKLVKEVDICLVRMQIKRQPQNRQVSSSGNFCQYNHVHYQMNPIYMDSRLLISKFGKWVTPSPARRIKYRRRKVLILRFHRIRFDYCAEECTLTGYGIGIDHQNQQSAKNQQYKWIGPRSWTAIFLIRDYFL